MLLFWPSSSNLQPREVIITMTSNFHSDNFKTNSKTPVPDFFHSSCSTYISIPKAALKLLQFYSNFYLSDICELYVTNFRFMLATSGFTHFRSRSFLVQHTKFFKLFLLLFMYICMNILKNFEPSRILHREVETLFQKAS